MTVAAVPDKPQETPAEETPKSFRDVLGDRFDQLTSETGAAEPAAVAKPADEATKPQDDQAAATDETPAAESWVTPTAEQLRDTAWWGALSKEGWERARKDPLVEVAAAHVTAAQAAGTKIVNDARAEAQRIVDEAKHSAAPPTDTRPDAQTEDEPSPELIAAVELSQSMDPREAAKGHLLIAKLTAAAVGKEIGVDPQRAKQQAIDEQGFKLAVQRKPELAQIARTNIADLDAIADNDDELKALLATNDPENIAIAWLGALRRFTEAKKAKDAAAATAAATAKAEQEKKDRQRVVLSNARPASADVLKPGGAAAGRVPFKQRLSERYDKEAASLSQ